MLIRAVAADPAAAPTSKAGEKTPPKKPNPNDSAVAIILAIKIATATINKTSAFVRFTIALVPNPITSGYQVPIMLSPIIAISKDWNDVKPIFSGNFENINMVDMKSTAISPKNGPKTIELNIMGLSGVFEKG